MKYTLTAHAATVLAERQIDMEWLNRTLSEPERVERDPSDPELQHRLSRIPEFGNRVLRVVMNTDLIPQS